MKNTVLILSSLLIQFAVLAKEKNSLNLTYTKTDVTCAGQNNGSISLSITGGKEPYQILWKDGQSTLELKNLRGGTYTVEVKDANGKSVNQNISIDEPTPLGFYYESKVLTSVDEFNGIMDISIFGGSPWQIDNKNDYFVRLNGKSYYEQPEKLQDGLYTLSIEDAKGCTFSLKVNMNIEVVKSATEVPTTALNLSTQNNSFGTINMFVVYHNLIESSILHNYSAQSAFD